MINLDAMANGIYPAFPKYDYALIDLVLAGYTLLHTLVALSHVTVSDASYKKSLLRLHRNTVKTFYDIPFFISGVTMALTLLAASLSYSAYQDPSNATIAIRAVIAVNTWICSIILQKLSASLIKLGVDHVMKQEQQVERHDIANWKEPPKWTRWIFEPMNWIIRPVVTGLENISAETPGLYVSNHALMGMEMPGMIERPWTLKGVFIRGLADHMHFGQLHGEFIRYFGGVDGTRDNVDTLMETKQNVLVYPGGGEEIMKHCSVPKYTLMWKERLGFVRMAIKHGYPIVPCCSVGTEDMMDRLWDLDASFMKKGMKMPLVVMPPHKLQRVYFWFGEPIPTAQYDGDWKNDDIAREVRDKVKAAVEAGIWEMKEKQANDPNRYFFDHIRNSANDVMTAIVNFCKAPFATDSPAIKELDETDSVASAEESVESLSSDEDSSVITSRKRVDTCKNDDKDDGNDEWEPISTSNHDGGDESGTHEDDINEENKDEWWVQFLPRL